VPKETDQLKLLDGLKQRAEELRAEEETVVAKIRGGFVERAIVFMDVVGSTKFKQEHTEDPERWILRVRQFSDLMASAARKCNGKVVKFIGDEIMVSFESVFDAQNFVSRVSEIEQNLESATGFPTRVKVAADFGKVYELKFDGHDAPDPQGSPVDRCARIGKFAAPGEVLCSATFAVQTPQLKWMRVGSTEMKGLGPQLVYQLGKVTVDLEPRIEVKQHEYQAVSEERDDLRTTVARLEQQNRVLQDQLAEAGEQPNPEASVGKATDGGREQDWQPIQDAIADLKKLIGDAPGSKSDFARFIFLYHSDNGTMTYNKFEGREFDPLIEANLVRVVGQSSSFELNPEHLRNQRILAVLRSAQDQLAGFLSVHDPDPSDLFDWTFASPEFWERYVGLSVQ
jgi:class 3 adenylate cyclase